MERITREIALVKTHKIWSKLAKSGSRSKDNEFLFGCACCEHVIQEMLGKNWKEIYDNYGVGMLKDKSCISREEHRIEVNCKDACPMKQHWPDGCLAGHYDLKERTDYSLWEIVICDGTRKKHAKSIAKAAKNILLEKY